MATSPLSFTVRRHEPVLVAPTRTTPHELKPLSDLDDQKAVRFHISGIHFFPNNPLMQGRDPARVIREALAEALVFYYPLAGRLRERPDDKLEIECTGEGVLFVEADASVRLEEFGEALRPPFPCLDELFHNAEASAGIVDSPLFLIQVTRLECGGFILAHKINHVVADAAGLLQFLKTIAELARGAIVPTVLPVWERELLTARDPPCPTHLHPEYDAVAFSGQDITLPPVLITGMVRQSFFFGPREMSCLRMCLPNYLRSSSRIEILTGFVWRSRTVALGYAPEEEAQLLLVVNGRGRCYPPLPDGFYGNAVATVAARSPVGELCGKPPGHAVELVRKAKSAFTADYLQSVADMIVLRGRPQVTITKATFMVSDVTRTGFDEVDFGWGEAAYAGPALSSTEPLVLMGTYYTRTKNNKGEEGVLVPLCLPAPAMERFMEEIEKVMIRDASTEVEEPDKVADSVISPPVYAII